MFAIYGTAGQIFHGPFEEMRQVARTLRTSAIQPLTPAHERVPFALPGVSAEGGAGRPAPRPAAGQALQTYAQVQQPAPTRQPLTRVIDIMSREPQLLSVDSTVWQGLLFLAERGIGQAPVVNAAGQLVGLLTRAQLFLPEHLPDPEASPLVWRARAQLPVSEWMVSPVPSVEPDTDIRRVASALLELGLPGLPVVAPQGDVLGFVSRADILKAVAHDPPLDLWAG